MKTDDPYDNVSDYLNLTRYTYDDLMMYFRAVNAFAVHSIPFNDPLYGIIRSRTSEQNRWTATYIPVVIKRY